MSGIAFVASVGHHKKNIYMAALGGWDSGRVYTTAVYAGEQRDDSQTVIEQKFVDFLRNFRLEHEFIYR